MAATIPSVFAVEWSDIAGGLEAAADRALSAAVAAPTKKRPDPGCAAYRGLVFIAVHRQMKGTANRLLRPLPVERNLIVAVLYLALDSAAHARCYSYTTTATNSPTITSGGIMSTGYLPFSRGPVYVGYSPSGFGTTIFDI